MSAQSCFAPVWLTAPVRLTGPIRLAEVGGFAITLYASLTMRETCHPELCLDVTASLIVQETDRAQACYPERSEMYPFNTAQDALAVIPLLDEFLAQSDEYPVDE